MTMRRPSRQCRAMPALLAGWLITMSTPSLAQSTIRLYPGVAPGSETWTFPETRITLPYPGGPWVANVSVPTLRVFRPSPAKSNGTAFIVCPGGAFHFLTIDNEGTRVAEWLRARGITAFVLKYRILQTTAEHIRAQPNESLERMSAEEATVFPLAVADGRLAVGYVRAHAAEYGILPGRVGMIGFSAGGMIALTLAVTSRDSTAPDFVAPIYAPISSFMRPFIVPATAAPLFLVVASDDQLGFASSSTEVYDAWIAAHRSAELHAYAKGGHGFGMLRQRLPVDSWIERFEDWLAFQGLLKRPGNP
jgi:acetyl esterase/lipase